MRRGTFPPMIIVVETGIKVVEVAVEEAVEVAEEEVAEEVAEAAEEAAGTIIAK
jgi:hypothetical protein